MARARKVERGLVQLGSTAKNLDEAFQQDGLEGVSQALKAFINSSDPDLTIPILLPNGSRKPPTILRGYANAVRNYRQFANGESPLAHLEDEAADEEDPELTQEVIRAAMDECDRLGESNFLKEYRFGKPRDYRVAHPENAAKSYPAKAIVGVAYKYLPNGEAWTSEDVNGGISATRSAANVLENLGFRIIRLSDHEDAIMPPTNLILHGPPGTGKTFATAREAIRLCGSDVPDGADRKTVMTEYRRLLDAGRIEFVTFHQSYSYEDFVEGLRPRQTPIASPLGETMGDAATARAAPSVGFELVPTPGIFKRIARRAQTSTGKGGNFKIGERRVFKMSIGEAANPEDNYLFEEALATGYVLLGWGDRVDWSPARFTDRRQMLEAWRPHHDQIHQNNPDARPLDGNSGYIKYPDKLRNWVREDDIIIVSRGNGLFRAIGRVTGPYEYAPRENDTYANRRKVEWLWKDPEGVPVEEIYNRSFIQSPLYELSRSDLRIPLLERYIGSQQPRQNGQAEQFVLIIDEINRANISKVFGELITLLEPDKRLGMDNRLTVTLPYSQESFGVPQNLHIVGTMNTADRSIALLDTALRRRFDFQELMPEPETLFELVDGVPLRAWFTAMNARIEYLFDREHQIGHAFFIDCKTRAAIDQVMRRKVIPLLQEYFYEDWAKVAQVLGDTEDHGRFLECQSLTPPQGITADEDRKRWSVKKVFGPDAYNV
jgi:hypothetical protein